VPWKKVGFAFENTDCGGRIGREFEVAKISVSVMCR
jgi:hypothetical protein